MERRERLSLMAAFGTGLVFGLGLTVSQMISPRKVLDFLDIAGNWDPSLALVIAAAVAVTFVGYRFSLSQPHPLLADRFQIPTRTDIDGRLLTGAALFGIGWGLAGYCPGPAITALGLGNVKTLVFVVSMAAGMMAYSWLDAMAKSRGARAA